MKALINQNKKWLLPVGVIVIAYGIATVIRNAGPELEIIAPEQQALLVRVVTAEPQQVQLQIDSQGEVNAEHTIDLVNELPGKIKSVSPAFVTGGYFKAGDVLLELDATDYELARIRAAAQVAEADEELEIERSEAELAKEGLFPLRDARVASAEARVSSARAELAQAAADLRRTRIRAPFDGRVLFTTVDLGQYVSKGEALGRIFSSGIAEIRLPLTDQQLRFLESPFGPNANQQLPDTPVLLRANVGDEPVEWTAQLDRMEGAVDPDNRVWYAVARYEDPYGLTDEKNSQSQTPLVVGLFVEAMIQGRTVEDVTILPRQALRGKETVLVVDSESRLRQRKVDVLRTDFESVYVTTGLEQGDRVCVSPVEAFVDGMLVDVIADPQANERLAVK